MIHENPAPEAEQASSFYRTLFYLLGSADRIELRRDLSERGSEIKGKDELGRYREHSKDVRGREIVMTGVTRTLSYSCDPKLREPGVATCLKGCQS